MVEPDFENIIRKYRSLISPSPDAKSSQRSHELPVGDSKESFKGEFETSSDSFGDSNFSDDFIGDDRFLRAPVAAPEQNKNPNSVLENLVFNSLFASVDLNDEFNQLNKIDQLSKGDENQFNVAAADLANRIYHQEVDLRKHYNPGLGIYPSQALYSPSNSKYKNKESDEKKAAKQTSFEKLDSDKPSSAKETSLAHPKEVYEFISRMTDEEKNPAREDKEKPTEDTLPARVKKEK